MRGAVHGYALHRVDGEMPITVLGAGMWRAFCERVYGKTEIILEVRHNDGSTFDVDDFGGLPVDPNATISYLGSGTGGDRRVVVTRGGRDPQAGTGCA